MRVSAVALFAGLTSLVPAFALPAPDAVPDAASAAMAEVKPPAFGINDPTCKAQPGYDPIVMLHGLVTPAFLNWATKAPTLAAAGYCVYTPEYGTYNGISGAPRIEDSAAQVAQFIDRLLVTTGAAKVNLVAHSVGTVTAAYYMKVLGGAAKVNHYIGFGAMYRGSSVYGFNKLLALAGLQGPLETVCPACAQLLTTPSPVLDALNTGALADAHVKWLNVATRLDEVVLPYTSGIVREAGVTNVVLQEWCPLDLAGHLGLALDVNVSNLILWRLNGQQGRRPRCVPFVAPVKREAEAIQA